MADSASSSITIAAPPAAVMGVIADFGNYPQWLDQVRSATVDSTGADGRAAEVTLVLDAGVVRDTYTLAYVWSGDDEVSWTLVRGLVQKAQRGRYSLHALPDGGTDVRYELAVDLAIPMLGLVKRRAEKMIIDAALRGLKRRVEELTAH